MGYGRSMVHDGYRIIFADDAPRSDLLIMGHLARLGDTRIGYVQQFWYPRSNECPIGILIVDLFGRRVDPNRIDTRSSRLHLNLAVMNTGLVVQKQSR